MTWIYQRHFSTSYCTGPFSIVIVFPFAGSLHEDDTSRFPELDIIALDVKSGQEVPVFEKHVMIIHKNRGCPPEDLSAIVDNQGLPNQQVGNVN